MSYYTGGYIPLNCRPLRQQYVACRQRTKPEFGVMRPGQLQRMQNGSFAFRQWLNATGARLGNFQPSSRYYDPLIVQAWQDYKDTQPGFRLAPRGRVVPLDEPVIQRPVQPTLVEFIPLEQLEEELPPPAPRRRGSTRTTVVPQFIPDRPRIRRQPRRYT